MATNPPSKTMNANVSRWLIVGLGNPGREFQKNRHNVGFMLLDRVAERLGVTFSRLESKALIAKGEHDKKIIILAKPQTFMNLSGQAVNSLVRFYKIPLEQVLIIYDDIDLPFETLRMRKSGGSGGHQGMASIIECLNSQDFPRMRIGVGRPPGQKDAATYVLKNFSPDEQLILPIVITRGVEAVLHFTQEGIDSAMNKCNPSSVDD